MSDRGGQQAVSLALGLLALVVVAASFLTLAGGLQAEAAGSLWAQAAGGSAGVPGPSWIADHRAAQVGDLLTLVVVEQTQAVQAAKSDGSDSAGFSVGGSGLLARYIPLFGFSGQDKTSGAGTTSRTGSLSARLTVRVTQMQPGGLLHVEGEQKITVNGEEQELVVSGWVRQQDILPDNSVLSTYLADAQITVKGNGTLGKQAEPGLLSKLLSWLL